jgi:hypothetical protein
MLLQRFTMGRMPGLGMVVHNTTVLLKFLGAVAVPWPLFHRVSLGE